MRDITASLSSWNGEIGSNTNVQNVVIHGADPTGVAVSQSGVQSAIDAAGASGNPSSVYWPPGIYRYDSGIITTFSNQTWLMTGVRHVPFSTFADDAVFTIGQTSAAIRHFRVVGGIHIASAATAADDWNWDDTIGVDLVNSQFGNIDDIVVERLLKGLQLRGHNMGCTYNNIGLNRLRLCKWSLRLINEGTAAGGNAGFCNQNTFIGGKVQLQTDIGSQNANEGYGVLLNQRAILTDKITDATNATPIVYTCSVGHGLETGDEVTISGVVTGSGAGDATANITGIVTLVAISAPGDNRDNQFKFSIDGSTGVAAYVSGGTVTPMLHSTATMNGNVFLGLSIEGNENDDAQAWPYGMFLNCRDSVFVNVRFELGAGRGQLGNIFDDTIAAGRGCQFYCPIGTGNPIDNFATTVPQAHFHGDLGTRLIGGRSGVPVLALQQLFGLVTDKVFVISESAGSDIFYVRGNGGVGTSLPTSDPGVAGELWVDIGDGRRVKSSAG